MTLLQQDASKPGRPVLVAGIIVYLLACAVVAIGLFVYNNQRAADAMVVLLTCGIMLAVWPVASRAVNFKRKLAGRSNDPTPLESAMKTNWRGITGGVLLASAIAAIAAAIFGLPA